ncbi:MAG: hypothetical protein OXC81_08080, partial [Betaproteobacteria bacterium]|nr:hypothetical protein [Betaproteobacteria bacterium]
MSDLFTVVRGCVEDIGAAGTDDATGLGRLDLGCLAFEAYKANNPAAVLSTAVIHHHPLPTCSDDRIVINNVCVPKSICLDGQTVNGNNQCQTIAYWPLLGKHDYLANHESPLQLAWRNAGIADAKVDRSDQAYLLDGGAAGRQAVDLLSRMGVSASQYSYLELTGDLSSVATSVIVSQYTALASRDLVNFSFSTSPFVTDTSTSIGISTSDLESGAWVLLDTGDDRNQDPLLRLPRHFSDGLKAAAATGKLHFYYGLNDTLDGRDAQSSGCKHINDYCIGAPYRFNVQLRNNQNVELTSKASTFAFAAYLGAWQRLPERSRVSAVFDLARNCVEDLSTPGSDDETGAGRLDIGCLAYQVTRQVECPDGQELTAQGVCEPIVCEADELPIGNACFVKTICPVGQELNEADNTCQPLVCPTGSTASGNSCTYVSYWTQMQSASYATGSESPLQKAFRVASTSTVKINRSAHTHVMFSGSASQGNEIVDFLAGAGVAGSQYTYRDLSGMADNKIRAAYLDLTNADFVYFPFINKAVPFALPSRQLSTLAINSSDVINRAWIITDSKPTTGFSPHHIFGAEFVSNASGKIHSYYGLDTTNLTVRHSSSVSCTANIPSLLLAVPGIQDNCIGAPYSLMVRLRDNSTKTLTGIPAAFAFAAYLNAWERMPERTHISAVFDLALGCVEDIGVPGADRDTGLGRLDIGCLAYEAVQATECEDEAYILRAATCGWDYFFDHTSASITVAISPHRRAFKDAGTESRLVDRSIDAYVLDSASHGRTIRRLLASIDLAATVNYTYMELDYIGTYDLPIAAIDPEEAYELLSSTDMVSASWGADFNRQLVTNGAWILKATGNDGERDSVDND